MRSVALLDDSADKFPVIETEVINVIEHLENVRSYAETHDSG